MILTYNNKDTYTVIINNDYGFDNDLMNILESLINKLLPKKSSKVYSMEDTIIIKLQHVNKIQPILSNIREMINTTNILPSTVPDVVSVKKNNIAVEYENYTAVIINNNVYYILENNDILSYNGPIPEDGLMDVLCVTLSTKWYSLYLISSDGKIRKYNPPIDEVSYCDDKWNPKELYKYCEKNDIYIDDIAYELICGRWEIEHLENY